MTGVAKTEEAVSADAYTPRHIKDAALELLKYGLLESSSKPNLYRAAITHSADINRVLESLDLSMRVDDMRGLAYVVVAASAAEQTDDEWSHPLVRRQRLNLEQSLLIAILRQQFVAHEQQAGRGGRRGGRLEDCSTADSDVYGALGSDSQEQKAPAQSARPAQGIRRRVRSRSHYMISSHPTDHCPPGESGEPT